MLLAIDPGMNSPGIAVFGGAALLAADRIRSPDEWASLPDGQRWLHVARGIYAQSLARVRLDTPSCLDVIFERPQWYARGKSKGDPNQLAGVAGVAACAVGLLSGLFALRVFSPKPAEWIGQLPKTCRKCGANKKSCAVCKGSAWLTPRGRFIRKRLVGHELSVVPDQNDAIDAVGLGLWALGRLKPHSALSNGRDGR